MIAATAAVVLAEEIVVEGMIAARLAVAAAVVMIEELATVEVVMAVEVAGTAVAVEIAAEVEAGRRAEVENLPAPGLASRTSKRDVADSECQPQAKGRFANQRIALTDYNCCSISGESRLTTLLCHCR
jgi:hypothetical protein